MNITNRFIVFLLALFAISPVVKANTAPTVVIKSATMRPGTTLMDIVFRVNDPDDATVKTRALAFQDGWRGFSSGLIRPTAFVEGTSNSIGDSVATNTDHTLSWDVAVDWNVQLGQVKFEVLAMDGRGLVPIEWITIPASGGKPEVTISKNPPTDAQVMDALFWLYASGDEDLVVYGSGLAGSSSAGDFYSGYPLVSYSTPGLFARPFIYKKMNLAVAELEHTERATEARAGLGSSAWAALRKPYEGFTAVVAWGSYLNLRASIPGAKAVAAGANHFLVLKSDGTVMGWGDNSSGQINIPNDLKDVTSIAAGAYHSLALKSDGTLVAWGNSYYASLPEGLNGVESIGASRNGSYAVKKNGAVVEWPSSGLLESGGAVAHGAQHSLILQGNGTLRALGDNTYGQTRIPDIYGASVLAITAGDYHNLALVRNWNQNVAYAWGAGTSRAVHWHGAIDWPHYGQSNPGWSHTDQWSVNWGVVAIAAGAYHSVFLKENGTVETWGYESSFNRNAPPSGLGSVAAIGAGHNYTVALTKVDTP